MKDFAHTVIIGRFQPLHNSHVQLIEHAGSIADNVLVLVGSARTAPTIKNPFSFVERKKLIEEAFPEYLPLTEDDHAHHGTEWTGKMHVLPLRDYFYSDAVWVSQVQALTSQFIKDGDSVALIGNYKDESSYYLRMFPQWEFVPFTSQKEIDGTTVRKHLFDIGAVPQDWEGISMVPPGVVSAMDKHLKKLCPEPTMEFLKTYRRTRAYTDRCDEYSHNVKYQREWGTGPFVTADAVVSCSGHVLVIKRGFNPGRGLYALPGGFVKGNERIQAGALRELKEETRIRVDKLILESNIVDSHVFDHPGRSVRGRTITHAYHIKLRDGKLPEISFADDAAGSLWMPIMDVSRLEEEFFEDHAHIIQYFLQRGL